MAASSRQGGVGLWVLAAIVLLAGVGGGATWWYFGPSPRVTSYLKVARNRQSYVIEQPSITEEEYRRRQGNHLALITSPLVLDAVLQQQDIANLELVNRQGDPFDWLTNSLQVSFPSDGEIMEIVLPCAESDSQDGVKIVDAVTKAYFDKVLLQWRLQDAAAQVDFGIVLQEFDDQVKADIEKLQTLKAAAGTPSETALAMILENDCDANLELRRDLKVKELRLRLQKEIDQRNEQNGGVGPGEVVIMQKATFVAE